MILTDTGSFVSDFIPNTKGHPQKGAPTMAWRV